MATQSFAKIREIEEKAQKIVSDARHAAVLNINRANRRHEDELRQAEESAKKEAEAIVRSAEKEALKEAVEIEASAKTRIEELKKETAPKLEQAKQEILKCPS